MKLNKKIVNVFNGFLKVKDYKNPTKRSLNKYHFLKSCIIKNKLLTVREYEFCSTNIAKEFNVNSLTIRNWLKTLERQGFITCTKRSWVIGERSKCYKLTKMGLNSVNMFNGYNKKYKNHVKKLSIREQKWADFNSLEYNFKNCVFLCSSYLGCPKSLIKDLKENLPLTILSLPRETNVKETKFMDFYYAYNHSVKKFNALNNTNYSTITLKKFRKLIYKYFKTRPQLSFMEEGYFESYSDIQKNLVKFKKSLVNVLQFTKASEPKRRKRLRQMVLVYEKFINAREFSKKFLFEWQLNFDDILNTPKIITT